MSGEWTTVRRRRGRKTPFRTEDYEHALIHENYDYLRTVTPEMLRVERMEPCVCGCFSIPISAFILLKSRYDISIHVIKFLLDNNKISVHDACSLLFFWLRFSQSESCERINLILDWLIEHHRQDAITYTDDADHSLLSAAAWGFHEMKRTWTMKLLKARTHVSSDEIGDLAVDLDIDALNYIDKNMRINLPREYMGKSLIMSILDEYRHSKNPNVLERIRKTIEFLLDHNTNLDMEDEEGRNATNYVHDYRYTVLLADLLHRFPVPKAAQHIVKHDYSHQNPSPFASIMHHYRYDKDPSAAIAEIMGLVGRLGPPTHEECRDSGNLCDIEYISLSDLVTQFGFGGTSLVELFDPKPSSE